jgi:glucose-1-phosphate adenylyltransferase
VLTQFLSVSLHRHISNTYKFDPFNCGFVEVLAAQQTNEAADWYRGTADAVRQNIRYVQEDRAREVLVLSGDQLYRMDFRQLVEAHRASKADVTIAVVPVTRGQARNLGVVRVDDANRIVHLVEKPQSDEQLEALRTPAEWLTQRGLRGEGKDYLANMGIYLFRRETLFELLNSRPGANDFVTEVFPDQLANYHVRAHPFAGYWEDLGTIKSYYEANLALASDNPPFDFHTAQGVIYTRMRYLPASRVSAAQMEACLISDGCTIQPGARLERCVIGLRSRIGKNVTLRDTILIGADRFETDEDHARNRKQGIPDFTVGDDSVIERAILDKDCRVGRGVRLVNRRGVQNEEGSNYVVRDGILVIPNGAVVPDGTVL